VQRSAHRCGGCRPLILRPADACCTGSASWRSTPTCTC
jgi:hypothetical protein